MIPNKYYECNAIQLANKIEKQMERFATMFTTIDSRVAGILSKKGYTIKVHSQVAKYVAVVTIYRK